MHKFQILNPLEIPENIQYQSGLCKYGPLSVSFIEDGLLNCHFMDEEKFIIQMNNEFPNARLTSVTNNCYQKIIDFIEGKTDTSFDLLIRGTEFQLAVWNQLLEITRGQTLSYKNLAARSGYPNAIRAVGAAVGANSFAFLVPCHRILYSNGNTGHYRWGSELKIRILEDEIPGLILKYSKTLFDDRD